MNRFRLFFVALATLIYSFAAFSGWDAPPSVLDTLSACEQALHSNRAVAYQLANMRIPPLSFSEDNGVAVTRINALLTPREVEAVEEDWNDALQSQNLHAFHEKLALRLERSSRANIVLQNEGIYIAHLAPGFESNAGSEAASRAQLVLSGETFKKYNLFPDVHLRLSELINLTSAQLDAAYIDRGLHRLFVETIASLEITKFKRYGIFTILFKIAFTNTTDKRSANALRAHLTSFAIGLRYLKQDPERSINFEYKVAPKLSEVPHFDTNTIDETPALGTILAMHESALKIALWLKGYGMSPQGIAAHLANTARAATNSPETTLFSPDVDLAIMNRDFDSASPASESNPLFILASQIKTILLNRPRDINGLIDSAEFAIDQIRAVPASFTKGREVVMVLRGKIKSFTRALPIGRGSGLSGLFTRDNGTYRTAGWDREGV